MLGSLTVAETEQVKQVSAIQAVKIKTINFFVIISPPFIKELKFSNDF